MSNSILCSLTTVTVDFIRSRRILGTKLYRPFYHGLFASPEYLQRRGQPMLENLDGHERIAFRFNTTGRLQPWLRRGGEVMTFSPPRIMVSTIEGARKVVVAGLGMAWLPDFILKEDVESGRLVRVLEEEVDDTGQFFLVWPASRAMPRRLRALIDRLLSSL